MTTYKYDNSEIEASTPVELVTKMHMAAWVQSKDDREFMQSVADRLVVQSSLDVRHDTAKHFVEDLIKHGVLVVL